MPNIDQIFINTEQHIGSLELTYLKKYIDDPTSTPIDYDYHVKSFCILSHAALEDFSETIALTVMNATIENFINHHTVSESLVSLMHFKSNGEGYLAKGENDNKVEIVNSFDYIRDRLNDIKTRFSKEVFNNHGASIKYLKQLFMPVSIDLPNDPSLLNSLKLLAQERGFHAHKFLDKGAIKRSISPEDAKNIVDDCLKICSDIRDKAKTKV